MKSGAFDSTHLENEVECRENRHFVGWIRPWDSFLSELETDVPAYAFGPSCPVGMVLVYFEAQIPTRSFF